ncbi:MAG: NmrA family protein, partial [uncultured bacterium]
LDRRIAYSTVHAAREAGVDWILHFTGLGNPAHLSEQLRSRYEVGEILALGGARVTQLRASLVLGSGGASFEMIQAFCGYLRIMFAPRWMDARCQPIAIANVVEYLAGCLEHPETAGQVYEIGGPDVLTWRELFRIYADEAELPQRLVLVLPMRIHRISIWWMNLVTPVSVALIRPLVERIGGNTGWYFGTCLWRLRGFVDELLGGPGLSRGRRHVDSVAVGDHLDFWRVVAVEEPCRLLLRAEMLAPGVALLEFRVQVLPDGSTELRMTPSFEPRGFAGRIYWWIIAPSHSLLFRSMLKQMVKAAGVRVLSGPSCVADG